MLAAEIFILRLKNALVAARTQKEVASANNPRFVPFAPTSQFTFKDGTVAAEQDPLSYSAANPAVVRTSGQEPIREEVPDANAKDAIASIFADIEAAENRLFVVLAITLPVAIALLTFALWS